APTFIDANELQLNKAKSFYSFTNQLILLPNFFDTQFSNIEKSSQSFFHPLSSKHNQLGYRLIFFIFPFLYILGSLIILVRNKLYRELTWIPILIFLFLFLSMKEYSLLGFIYAFLNKVTPFFGVLFRFGDTKFHPFIAFGGSIAAAIAVTTVIDAIRKYRLGRTYAVWGFFAMIIISTLFVYKTYFTGNLIGFFMYTKIPQAYFNISKTINTDKGNGRVVHLPYDRNIYWRSYHWGYLGSQFLAFMVNKPVIDKTFEPASMENAYLLKRIYDLTNNMQSIQDPKEADQRSEQFYNLLKQTGVKYIVMDETISVEQPSRDAIFWGDYNITDSKSMLDRLTSNKFLKKIQTENVTSNNGIKKIVLYELRDTQNPITFLTNVHSIDSTFKEVLQTDIPITTNYFQDSSSKEKTTFPFKRLDSVIDLSGNTIKLSNNSIPERDFIYTAKEASEEASFFIDVSGRKDGDNLIITLYRRLLPSLDQNELTKKIDEFKIPLRGKKSTYNRMTNLDQFVSNWHILPHTEVDNLRLRVEDTIIPVPSELSSEQTYIASVIVHDNAFPIEVLHESNNKKINPQEFSFTSNPNCYSDKLA
ncbi:MAG TPA: hypothetical protein VK338_03730, partial [Candidatus Nitrosocosmicus sp.]|nr:hypothetical protein [Candidatus Nitrosocosmicus sp.]